ncbi:MAG: helix-turn-helix transcriptional regulator [Clostridia bacterium]|nr:helix-turn-helix transcriptional regulator [Clostridia bacterium]
MKMKLAENIRAFRRKRSLTQEQLAEVLGVTVGAVHKWETRLSVPEMPMIVEMADFFDCSVDALLGYEMKDNRLAATEARIWQYHNDKNRDGLIEVEKALKKYPNTFTIAYAGAMTYHGIGFEARDKALLHRALELYRKARQLLPQNQDASISDQTLCGAISQVYFALGEKEKAIELAKAHNAGNLYSAMIGEVLAAEMNRPEDALPFLSHGLMSAFNGIIYTAVGYAYAFRSFHDPENGMAVLQWALKSLLGLKASDRPDFIDKVCAYFTAWLACFQMETGDVEAARASLIRAAALARAFDVAPDYSCRNLLFVADWHRDGALYDSLGATATEAVENAVKDTGSAALLTMYMEMANNAETEV